MTHTSMMEIFQWSNLTFQITYELIAQIFRFLMGWKPNNLHFGVTKIHDLRNSRNYQVFEQIRIGCPGPVLAGSVLAGLSCTAPLGSHVMSSYLVNITKSSHRRLGTPLLQVTSTAPSCLLKLRPMSFAAYRTTMSMSTEHHSMRNSRSGMNGLSTSLESSNGIYHAWFSIYGKDCKKILSGWVRVFWPIDTAC